MPDCRKWTVKAKNPALSMMFEGSVFWALVWDKLVHLLTSLQRPSDKAQWASSEFRARIFHIQLHCSSPLGWIAHKAITLALLTRDSQGQLCVAKCLTTRFQEKQKIWFEAFHYFYGIRLSLNFFGVWFQDPPAEVKIHECFSPLHKMEFCSHISMQILL